jgi:hypothetical protein
LGFVGSRHRWRLDLPDAPPSVAFGGLIRAEWADRFSLRSLTATERIGLVLANGPLPIPARPGVASLDLAGGGGIAWARTKDWNRAREAVRCLLDALPT